ncbi:hypothetical protein QZH41_011269 [Actinostola sp. cb2023]|nr:hypothetical protein QZH41_011269 [Actinostola sp. cb2023]
MEREISNRNDIETAYNSIKKKSEGLCQTLGKRLNNVYSKKSFPKAEQDRFAKATFDKGKALKKRIDVFFFGGQVYLEHRKASKSFDGLLDLKLVASNRGDTPYFRELQMMFDELNSFTRFLSKDIETIIDYINRCGNITRKYNLDIQAKGPQGLATRKSAKRNKQKGLASLGDAPSIFIPLTNVLIGVQNTDKKVQSSDSPIEVEDDEEEDELKGLWGGSCSDAKDDDDSGDERKVKESYDDSGDEREVGEGWGESCSDDESEVTDGYDDSGDERKVKESYDDSGDEREVGEGWGESCSDDENKVRDGYDDSGDENKVRDGYDESGDENKVGDGYDESGDENKVRDGYDESGDENKVGDGYDESGDENKVRDGYDESGDENKVRDGYDESGDENKVRDGYDESGDENKVGDGYDESGDENKVRDGYDESGDENKVREGWSESCGNAKDDDDCGADDADELLNEILKQISCGQF